MPSTLATFEFLDPREKEPPIDVDLLCRTEYSWQIYTFGIDSEYGKRFSGFEDYVPFEHIIQYAILPKLKDLF